MQFDPRAPLDELLGLAEEKYAVAFEPVTAGGVTLEILQIANMPDYVEHLAESSAPTSGIELPFWAKIWTAAIMLAHFVQRMEPGNRTALEIGAGVGVAGLFAAAKGFQTVISDVNEEALLFEQINVLKNGLEDRATVMRADFAETDLKRRFDCVLGAEVLYRPDTHRGLVKFLLRHLKPSAESEILLARKFTQDQERFLKLANDDFHIADKTIGLKSTSEDGGEAERHLITIHRLTPRKHV
jgi:predicted nicotinamide N-methyase